MRRSRACLLDRVDEPQGGWDMGCRASTQGDPTTDHTADPMLTFPPCRSFPDLSRTAVLPRFRRGSDSPRTCRFGRQLPSCRRCAPWPFMIVSQCRQGSNIMAFGMGVKWAVLEECRCAVSGSIANAACDDDDSIFVSQLSAIVGRRERDSWLRHESGWGGGSKPSHEDRAEDGRV